MGSTSVPRVDNFLTNSGHRLLFFPGANEFHSPKQPFHSSLPKVAGHTDIDPGGYIDPGTEREHFIFNEREHLSRHNRNSELPRRPRPARNGGHLARMNKGGDHPRNTRSLWHVHLLFLAGARACAMTFRG